MQTKFKFLKYLLCIAMLSGWHIGAQAQSATMAGGKASMSKEGKITLQQGQALQYNNVLDISHMSLSESATSSLFTQKNTDLVTFQPDAAKKVVYVQIELRARPNWTLEDWNAYLAKL
ncbi:MAG TPA: hypothetical protein VK168_00760 [Saprospiraceae bacterium]|nr:hypothetical protein [Saprospiraceae bacterium]